MRRTHMAALAVAGFIGGIVLAAAPAGELDRAALGRQADGRVVVPTNQVIAPAGFQVEFPGRPTDLALSPDGRLLAVTDDGSLVLIRVSDRAIMQTLPLPKGQGHSFVGIVWAPDGGTIFASATAGRVNRVKIEGGVATLGPPIALPSPGGKGAVPCGLALTPDAATLYVCLSRSNALAAVDAASGEVKAQIPVGVAPDGVVVAGATAYVTNWGGRHPAAGEPSAESSGTPTLVSATTGVAASGTVSVVDLAQGKEIASIAVGLHPCGLTLNRDASRLFIANANSDTVSVIATASKQVVETIHVTPAQGLPLGSAPNALALSPDGQTLYVANGGNNALAVVRLGALAGGTSRAQRSEVVGFIPTGWYPGSVLVSADGRTIFAANVKGVGSLNTQTDVAERWQMAAKYLGLKGSPPAAESVHSVFDARGSVSFIAAPDEAALKRYTQRVAENNRVGFALAGSPSAKPGQRVPVPLRQGQKSVFEHVIYIIKENRTYDQVFGDMPQGNGEPALVHFGEEVTPNHHKLAREFVLLDNTYCSGVLSADGHQWTDEAYVTDYLEKAFSGWERSYPYWGGDALAYAPTGFLWDNALAHGLTFRDYGEFVRAEIEPPNATWSDIYADYLAAEGPNPREPKVKIRSTTTVAPLRPYLCPTFIGFPGTMQDVYRAREFLKEFRQFEAQGSLPNLIMMLLPNDHTSGTKPGMPTPRAMVADNDLALGRIVEAVSHSKFWAKTCFFVVEDDAQAGVDHVDGHRTVALVISPYTKRGAVVSANYNQTSIVRTIELILGLPPMNQFDLSATPMAACFTDKPDFTPYRVAPNRIRLDEMNPPLQALSGAQRYWAMKSQQLPLEEVDQADPDTLNRILWHAVKGYNTPYPRLASARP